MLLGSAIALKLQSFYGFMKVHESSGFQSFINVYVFMISWLLMKRTTATNATAFWREHMASLFTSPPLLFGNCNTSSFRDAMNLLPWRPFESPRPKRLCAATHCRTIVQSRYHGFTTLDWVATLFSCSASTLKSAFQFLRSSFREAKLSNPGHALSKRVYDQTFPTTHCRNSNNWDFMVLQNSIALRLCVAAAQSTRSCKVL